jgi:hypothetical protein
MFTDVHRFTARITVHQDWYLGVVGVGVRAAGGIFVLPVAKLLCGEQRHAQHSNKSHVPHFRLVVTTTLANLKSWIRDVRSSRRCDWCRASRPMPRTGLCMHCNRVQLELENLRKYAEREPVRFDLKFYLNTAEEMKKSCMRDGKASKQYSMEPALLN